MTSHVEIPRARLAVTTLESRCDHPVTCVASCEICFSNYDTCLGPYRRLPFALPAQRGDYATLDFAGIGRTPQFAIGTSLSCVGGFAATQRKTRRSPKGQNIVAGVAREATYLETWWRCRFGNEPERQQRRIGFPITHHALIAILFCTGVWPSW